MVSRAERCGKSLHVSQCAVVDNDDVCKRHTLSFANEGGREHSRACVLCMWSRRLTARLWLDCARRCSSHSPLSPPSAARHTGQRLPPSALVSLALLIWPLDVIAHTRSYPHCTTENTHTRACRFTATLTRSHNARESLAVARARARLYGATKGNRQPHEHMQWRALMRLASRSICTSSNALRHLTR